jgi:hypothetical protein
MKKLFIVALLVVGMTSFAQEEKQDGKSQMEQMTPEQKKPIALEKDDSRIRFECFSTKK